MSCPVPPPPSFLTLPPDLRHRIYTHLLVSPTPIKGPTARLHSPDPHTIHTSILRVNTQINSEARHIFLSLNTFHITSLPRVSRHDDAGDARKSEKGGKEEGDRDRNDEEEEEDLGSGAFEPPLQLKDLRLVRSLHLDLVYRGGRDAQRYITSLAFLLREVQGHLKGLRIVADARVCWGRGKRGEEERGEGEGEGDYEHGSVDIKAFLAGFEAASRNWLFLDVLGGLGVRDIELRFDFAEAHFDFVVQREVLVKSDLVQIAGQVLVARTEIGIQGVLEELNAREDGERDGMMEDVV